VLGNSQSITRITERTDSIRNAALHIGRSFWSAAKARRFDVLERHADARRNDVSVRVSGLSRSAFGVAV
jgi:hypothetical protein